MWPHHKRVNKGLCKLIAVNPHTAYKYEASGIGITNEPIFRTATLAFDIHNDTVPKRGNDETSAIFIGIGVPEVQPIM